MRNIFMNFDTTYLNSRPPEPTCTKHLKLCRPNLIKFKELW